jgi:cytochrome c biogenesis protein CcmG/thiol:disulfide interchange protein DsbE
MPWQRRIAPLTGLVLLLSSCSVGDADTETGPSGAASVAADQVFSPVRVPGLESCAKLPASQAADVGGERLPDLSLPCLTGGPAVDLSQLAGRPVLVNLWATWCGPCREEMPILEDAYKQYAGEVSFVGVDTQDNPEAAAAFLREVGVTYPQLVDVDGQLLDHLGIPGLPITVVLDERGRVASRHVGPLTHETLRELVDGAAAT